MNQNERREFLRQSDLEMSKQIEKIVKEAQPKPPKDIQPLLLKPVYPKIELTGTPEYRANKQMTDLLLAQQLENTISEAMNAVLGTQTKPTANTVPQTMTDEYIKANEPSINADQRTLYNSVPIPVVPKPIPKPLPFKKTVSEAVYRTERERLINLHKREFAIRVRILEAEKDTEDLINAGNFAGIIPFDEAGRRAELDDKTKYKTNKDLNKILIDEGQTQGGSRADIINRIIAFEGKKVSGLGEAELKKRLANIQNDLIINEKTLSGIETQINEFDALYALQEKTKEENIEQEKNYKATLHQTAEELLDNFNLLNTGKLKITRQSGETDEELIRRIDNLTKANVNDKSIQNQITIKTFNQAKRNVLELTSEVDKAETVVKSLDIKEQDALNKMFPKIKEEFKKNFGLNNKSLSDDDIVQFIKNQITTGNALFTKPAPTAPTPAEAPAKVSVVPKAETKINVVGLKLYTKMLMTAKPEVNLKMLRTKPELINQLVDNKLWDEKDIYNYLQFLRDNPEVYEAQVAQPILTPDEEQFQRLAEATKQFEAKTGSGIKNHDLPSTVPFGKISLDLDKLYYQNILSIKRHNGNKIIGHRNKRVSDNFVDIIMKMFDNKPITQTDLKNIKDERLLYDNLIVQSGLHKSKSIPTTIEQTSQEMKNKLGLIVGEIEAGNSNKSLLTDLHELLFKMVRVHLISKSAATKYFNNLKDEYYALNPNLK